MNTVFNFITNYGLIVVLLIAIVFYIIAEWNTVKVIIYQAMLLAKKLAKEKILDGGKAQEDWVVENIYDLLPKRISILMKAFVSDERLRIIVHYLYTVAKDKLDDGTINGSIKEEG